MNIETKKKVKMAIMYWVLFFVTIILAFYIALDTYEMGRPSFILLENLSNKYVILEIRGNEKHIFDIHKASLAP